MYTRRALIHCGFAVTVLGLPCPRISHAQGADYPAAGRYITAVCMFAPGSGADIFVRFYARKLQELAGQTVVVENKAGMAGNIATEFVARSKPDGYTILIAPASSILVAGPFLYKKLNYDPIKDFASVTTLAKLPFVLVVAPDVGVGSVANLVARLKEKPDNGFYGAGSTVGLIASERFSRRISS
jgi:tripartite-type tricarboxylate transporter receptor subunit TctC